MCGFEQLTAGKILYVLRTAVAFPADKRMPKTPLYLSFVAKLLAVCHIKSVRYSPSLCLLLFRCRAHRNRLSVRREMRISLPLLSKHTYISGLEVFKYRNPEQIVNQLVQKLSFREFPQRIFEECVCNRMPPEKCEPTRWFSRTTPDEHPTTSPPRRWPPLITLRTPTKFQLVRRRLCDDVLFRSSCLFLRILCANA